MSLPTTALFRDDFYLSTNEAVVTAVHADGGIELDQTCFYATSGGQPGDTGFLYHQADEFRRHLRRLIDDAPTREKMAAKAHRHVSQKRALAHHVQRRYERYLSLVERRAELERLARERLSRL